MHTPETSHSSVGQEQAPRAEAALAVTPAPKPAAARIAVAIPCYRVRDQILAVLAAMPLEVTRIYVVDDGCPDGSGDYVERYGNDARIQLLRHEINQGVGAAVTTAYRAALAEGMDVVVKIDGDGQMDPQLLPQFVRPLLTERADYTKGNRFFRPESVADMPWVRLIGNAGLSFLTKLSCGYWSVMDPTNGYTAIHTKVLRELPLDRLEKRFFFETDMLFRLNTLGAMVRDIPIDSVYRGEKSNLRLWRIIPEFLFKHSTRMARRFVYNYLIRDFNVGSLYGIGGTALVIIGAAYGLNLWISNYGSPIPVPPASVMLATLPLLVGIQFLIAFLQYDMASAPRTAISPLLYQAPAAPPTKSPPSHSSGASPDVTPP